ncbi:hypothetical protein H257_11820 [Aphanomyces astaci]|uniref:protein-tyrosine-phosphatase n=1 Tax=Aphanomyces astaci TaxID=112090 RepID=W4G0P6_APHAT|nr:hypothetical protein H257_11820 [Aphanomyces astaci]ETV73282.1 hypothetical protein H257_11820 [Aphanomyces astaci]|eukprot:XP_009837157.1 hypothetical protein H257_11820 [Aphanomyces astaci]
MAAAGTTTSVAMKKSLSAQRSKPPCLALQPSLVQDNLPCEVVPKLWVGSVHAAFNFEAIKERKISHVLNVSGTVATYPQEFTYLTVDIRDKDYTNLLSCVPIATVFLESGMQHGGVLVHCAGGRSRSPAIVVAYLMSTLGTSFDEALIKVRTARPVASLNSGFEDQLRCFEKAKRDVYVAHQLLLQTKIVRARLRRSQQLDVDLYPPPKASSSAKKADMRMLLGTLPRGFYLSRPTSPKAQTFVPPLRSMGSQFGCAACGKLLFCAANVLRHSGTTDAALWTVAIDRKRAISCPETPRGRQGASLPLGRPFTDTGFDDDDDEETAHHDMLQASVVPSTCHDDDTLDMTLGAAIQDVVIGSTQADEKAIRPATTGDDASGRRRPVDGGSGGHITSSSPPPLPHNAGLSGSPPSSEMTSKNLGNSIQQSKKHWRSWTSLRPSSFGFRKANVVTSRSDVMSDELHTWRHQMKALEKHGSRHQIRRVSAAVAEDEKQFVAVMGSSGCDVIFIEPLVWFGSSLHPENGDLMCPNSECRATVGHYTWSDTQLKHQCACGGQVCPGFAVHKAAVKMLPAPTQLPTSLSSGTHDTELT